MVFKTGVADPRALADELIRTHGGQLRFLYRSVLEGFAAKLPLQALDGIRRNPNVDFVEADGVVSASESQHRPPSWGLDRIDQRDSVLDRYYVYQNSGAGSRVYLVDTGVELSHAEFAGRATSGWDFVDNDSDASDCYGHGTHVAGTVAGTTVGVAKQASIVSVRVLDCAGEGWWSQVIAGLDWIVANHVKPAVANLSIGGELSSALNAAIDNAVAAGITVTVAAGNQHTDACTRSPASAASALTVGAVTSSDARAAYSNYGTCLDLFAPGSSIYSAKLYGGYVNLSGTSMAAPHVAGVAALYLASHPAATPSAVRNAIIGGATLNQVADVGTGSPNQLLYSLVAADGPLPPPPVPPSANFSASCSGRTCQFTDQSSDSDGTITVWQWGFGDGSGDSVRNPAHSYGVAGTYQVQLVVQDNGGARDTVSREVVVADAPATNLPPSAGFATGCVRLTCEFVDASQDPDGNITTWEWSFGDGASLVNVASIGPSHVFPAGAVYRVSLTVTDDADAKSTMVKELAVGPVLTVTASKLKGKPALNLTWKGVESSKVDVYLNGSRQATVDNTGASTWVGSGRGQTTYRVRICEAGTTICSLEQTVSP